MKGRVFGILFGLFTGWVVTSVGVKLTSSASVIKSPIIPQVRFVALEGDQLTLQVDGSAKISWKGGEEMVVDHDFVFPVSQIDDEISLEFKKYAYVGNAKTNKFYPAYSYPARGTDIAYRRFFKSKQAALEAGFMASKLVRE